VGNFVDIHLKAEIFRAKNNEKSAAIKFSAAIFRVDSSGYG